MAQELEPAEYRQRHREKHRPYGHRGARELAGHDDHPDDELDEPGEIDELRIADLDLTEHVQLRPLLKQRDGERWIEQLLGQRVVRDAEAHRDAQHHERELRAAVVLERAALPKERIDRDGPAPDDE